MTHTPPAEDPLTLTKHLYYKLCRRIFNVEKDELFSVALVAIAKCLEKYDPSLDVPLGAYCASVGFHQAITELRSSGLVPRKTTPCYNTNGRMRTFCASQFNDDSGMDLDNFFSCSTPQSEADQREALEYIMRGLFPDQREILMMYFMDGMTHKDIGTRLGKSFSQIGSEIHRSLEILRDIRTPGDTYDDKHTRSV